jgi:hypothetical protein
VVARVIKLFMQLTCTQITPWAMPHAVVSYLHSFPDQRSQRLCVQPTWLADPACDYKELSCYAEPPEDREGNVEIRCVSVIEAQQHRIARASRVVNDVEQLIRSHPVLIFVAL